MKFLYRLKELIMKLQVVTDAAIKTSSRTGVIAHIKGVLKEKSVKIRNLHKARNLLEEGQ